MIKKFILRQKLKSIHESIARIKAMKKKVTHQPKIEDIPDKLDKFEELSCQQKVFKRLKTRFSLKLSQLNKPAQHL